jgi:cytoskeletal protein CcmA (bactofilin family)
MFSAKTSERPAAVEAPRPAHAKPMPSIISHQLVVLGNLTADGDIQVDGTVEGDIKTNVLTIGEGGTVKGAIMAETVVVAGTVHGQIRAKTVSLARAARVQGDIWHESLAIEAGARFEGSCKQLSAAPPAEGDVASWAKARRAAPMGPSSIEEKPPQPAVPVEVS